MMAKHPLITFFKDYLSLDEEEEQVVVARNISRKLKSLPMIKKIACGSWHSLALDNAGKVWAWGRNEVGMFGTGNDLDSSEPILVDGLKDIKEMGGGCFQSISVDTDGKIWTSGKNTEGQLGQEDLDLSLDPVEMKLPDPVEGLTLKQFMAGKELAEKSDSQPLGKTSANPLLIWGLGISVFINIALIFRRRKKAKE